MASAQSWQARWVAPLPQALYLHIPFCARKCFYCDFASEATPKDDFRPARYVHALISQLDELAELGLMARVHTAYLGGGTPSLLAACDLRALTAAVSATCSLEEFSAEANPESLDREHVDALAAGGVGRISLGVQSMVDSELTLLGRIHTAERAREALLAAHKAGLRTSADLICGIPLQTEASWQESLDAVLASEVGHVSVYPLVVEEGTPYRRLVRRGDYPAPDPDFQAACMEAAERRLTEAGLVRYEVASYARAGEQCAHNIAYWTARPYLGLGTNASSMLTRPIYEELRACMPQLPELDDEIVRIRMRILSSTDDIIAAPALAKLHLELELLCEQQVAAEDLMLGCRLVTGVDAGLLKTSALVLGSAQVAAACEQVEQAGLARINAAGALVPTHDGWLLGNELFGAMWDLAPASPRIITC